VWRNFRTEDISVLCKPEWEETCSIQGDSKGNVNILGGDSVGQCEKKISYMHVSNSERTERELFESANKKNILNGNREMEITVNFNFNIMFKRYIFYTKTDKFVAVHNKYSKRK